MPILPLDALPWILLAIVGVRAALTAGRLAVVREQLAETHARLREAQATRDLPPLRAPAAPADRDELDEAVRAALAVVRRDAPQLADTFTRMS